MVSIVTPAYNCEEYIGQTIDSVINQTYGDWEMLIVDDFSMDNTANIVQSYISRDNRIKLIQLEKNFGPAEARNRAIKEANGRFIAFLDSDDYWHRDKLSKQLEFMIQKSCSLSYTSYVSINEVDNQTIKTIHVPSRVDYTTLLKQNIMGCLTVIYDTQYLGKIYMPNIMRRQDYALWLKILKTIDFACGINEPLAYYRIRTSSISSNKIIASKYHWKVLRDIEKLPLYKAIYYFGWYTYKSILKYT